MARRARRFDVVEVEWLDSQHIGLGWKVPSEYVRAARLPQSYRTSGYLMRQGKGVVIVVLSIDPGDGHVAEVMSIPACAVKRIRVLGRSHRRVRRALRG